MLHKELRKKVFVSLASCMVISTTNVGSVAVPKPIRPGGNKRILDTIRRLAERPRTPIF